MIITRTPYRISFFGGGTDHPLWYQENGGKVLSTTIDKYCYISVRNLPQFFSHKYRIVYSKIESVKLLDDIQHPSVREVLKYFNSQQGLEIHHDGDLPARSGLGSSSSFTVGLINAMNALHGKCSSKRDLAETAIHIEQHLIKEFVGSQDQLAAAYGGFNEVEFRKNGEFKVRPKQLDVHRLSELNSCLMLFFTGVSRFSTEVIQSQLLNLKNCHAQMSEIRDLVDIGSNILSETNIPIEEFGKLLHTSWSLKKTLSKKISNSKIDLIYDAATKAGAIGGKVLGAGGGGFVVFFVMPDNQEKVKEALSELTYVPFKFENSGSKVVVNQPNGF